MSTNYSTISVKNLDFKPITQLDDAATIFSTISTFQYTKSRSAPYFQLFSV